MGRDATEEERLDRGIRSVATRTAVRAECQRRGELKGGGNRIMRAWGVGGGGLKISLRVGPTGGTLR